MSLLDVAPCFVFFFSIGLLKPMDGVPVYDGDSIGDANTGEFCKGISFMAILVGGGTILNFGQFFTISQHSSLVKDFLAA